MLIIERCRFIFPFFGETLALLCALFWAFAVILLKKEQGLIKQNYLL
ncbi:MAG: hypothetical protein ABIK47_01380 [candidate division WOR-3 bacterium]